MQPNPYSASDAPIESTPTALNLPPDLEKRLIRLAYWLNLGWIVVILINALFLLSAVSTMLGSYLSGTWDVPRSELEYDLVGPVFIFGLVGNLGALGFFVLVYAYLTSPRGFSPIMFAVLTLPTSGYAFLHLSWRIMDEFEAAGVRIGKSGREPILVPVEAPK